MKNINFFFLGSLNHEYQMGESNLIWVSWLYTCSPGLMIEVHFLSYTLILSESSHFLVLKIIKWKWNTGMRILSICQLPSMLHGLAKCHSENEILVWELCQSVSCQMCCMGWPNVMAWAWPTFGDYIMCSMADLDKELLEACVQNVLGSSLTYLHSLIWVILCAVEEHHIISCHPC